MQGEHLQEWRRARHLTQEQLAKKLGYSRSAVADWEGGKFAVPLVVELALKHLERRVKEAK